MKAQDNHHSTDSVNQVGPGQRLRQARIAANINIESISERLHLRLDLVEAIEADDYSRTSSHVFAKGYIRSYAKILGLNGDDLIAQFNKMGLTEPDSKRAVRQLRRSPEWENQHRQWRWGAVLTIFSVAVMGLLWWQANKSAVDEAVPTATIPTVEAPKTVTTPPPQTKPMALQTTPKVEVSQKTESTPPKVAAPTGRIGAPAADEDEPPSEEESDQE